MPGSQCDSALKLTMLIGYLLPAETRRFCRSFAGNQLVFCSIVESVACEKRSHLLSVPAFCDLLFVSLDSRRRDEAVSCFDTLLLQLDHSHFH
ncbi:MAG: hypothetical protein CBE43_04670 [Rhodopirellula sp. TMED283]|nr:MAG: hypothetical protein CBE43_04670 [Rhodopirellula sp. TMED283]